MARVLNNQAGIGFGKVEQAAERARKALRAHLSGQTSRHSLSMAMGVAIAANGVMLIAPDQARAQVTT
jgi:hypothetical protein